METKTQNDLLLWDLEVSEETLSFCDLPVQLEEQETNDQSTHSISNQDHFFEFSTTKKPEKALSPAAAATTLDHFIIFSGNFVNGENINPFDQRDSLLPLTSDHRLANKKINGKGSIPKKSQLVPRAPAKGRAIRRYTSLRVSKNVLIGFGRNVAPTRIELSDMKERQRKMAAARVVLGNEVVAAAEEEKPVVSKGDRSLVVVDANGSDGTEKGRHWSLLRTLRLRAYLTTVLNKASFGCLSAPAVQVA